jgi:hypothetical protein
MGDKGNNVLNFIYISIYLDRVFLCSPSRFGTYYESQDALEFLILLLSAPEC